MVEGEIWITLTLFFFIQESYSDNTNKVQNLQKELKKIFKRLSLGTMVGQSENFGF